MTETDALKQRWDAVMMHNYGTPPVALASGDGAVLTDVDGKTYLDLLGGIAVNVLGHRHPAVIEAVTHQMATLGHTSNLYATEPGIALAEELVALLGADSPARVFFCNSGTEANEVAFKMSRLTGRTKLVAAQEAYQRHLDSAERGGTAWMKDAPGNFWKAGRKAVREMRKSMPFGRSHDDEEDEV